MTRHAEPAGPWQLLGWEARIGRNVVLAEIVRVPDGTLRVWQLQAGHWNPVSETWWDLGGDYEIAWTPTHWMAIPKPA